MCVTVMINQKFIYPFKKNITLLLNLSMSPEPVLSINLELCENIVYQTWRLPGMNSCLKFTRWHRKKAQNQTKQ